MAPWHALVVARDPALAFLESLSDDVRTAITALQGAVRSIEHYRRTYKDARPVAGVQPPPRRSGVGLRFEGASVAEAAAQLGMSEDHVRRMLRAGELDGSPYSGRIGWRIDREYLAEVVAARAEQRRQRDEVLRGQAQPARPTEKRRAPGGRARPR